MIAAFVLPLLVGSIGYYYYKFGDDIWQLTFTNGLDWIHNWIQMQGIALVSITHTAIAYTIGVLLEPILLPQAWHGSVTFPVEMYEEYLSLSLYFFWSIFVILVLTLPLWKKGYALSMAVAGRTNVSMSYSEMMAELIYQTCTGPAFVFGYVPIYVILQNQLGIRIHCIHIILASVETVLLNYTLNYKFCILHQLMHDIKPLYAMAHLEHHVCRGIHPTTMGTGLWEVCLDGQGIMVMMPVGLSPIPFFVLQTLYSGINLVVHTMCPHPKLLQWHTLHHTILADIYGSNIPLPYDKEHSKTVQELQGGLKAVSPFVAYEALTDVVVFICMVSMTLLFHKLGVGITHVDWSKADWIYY